MGSHMEVGPMKFLELEINGEIRRVWAQKMGSMIWFHDQGQTYSVETKVKRQAKGAAVAVGQGEVQAPMPGKVLKVFVKQGQKVRTGEPLVVMEAMKMEYSFAAEFSGDVEFVGCAEGDQVQLAQALVRVKREDV
jgi:acetyl/propionyl-CoA carboxylase alpha subunit